MMRITAQGQTIEFDPNKLAFAEGRALEKVTGRTFFELAQQNFMGDLTSVQALVWVVFKRSQPTLRFVELDDWDIGSIELLDLTPEPEEPETETEPDPTGAVEPATAPDQAVSTPSGSDSQL